MDAQAEERRADVASGRFIPFTATAASAGAQQTQQRQAGANVIYTGTSQSTPQSITEQELLADLKFYPTPAASVNQVDTSNRITELYEETEEERELGRQLYGGMFEEVDVMDLAGWKRGRNEDDVGEREQPAAAASRNPAQLREQIRQEREEQEKLDGEARKHRARIERHGARPRPMVKKTSTRKQKALKPINAFIGKPPPAVSDVLDETYIEVPITWLAQWSRFFRDGAKSHLSQPRERRASTSKRRVRYDDEQDEDDLFDISAYIRAATNTPPPPASQPSPTSRPAASAAASAPQQAKAPQQAGPAQHAGGTILPTTPAQRRANLPFQASAMDMDDPDTLATTVSAMSIKAPAEETLEEIQADIMIIRASSKAAVEAISADILADIERWAKRNTEDEAFGLPTTLINIKTDQLVDIPRNQVLADTGADITLMYPHLRKAMNLPLHDSGTRFPSMSMSVAGGETCELPHFVVFDVHSQGVQRSTVAFVCPVEKTGSQKLLMILGLPLLHKLNAIINVREGTIQIGDPTHEKLVVLEAPAQPSVAPEIKVRAKDARMLFAPSDDESDSDEDEEMEDASNGEDSESSDEDFR
ncbi:hypothetical protein TI39_contig494g00004 [Zymoseptoria brevis]|uniref:Uncharacterized protein n=1 Tax=Zymoseptoria brevis TaxID=1047168 RepID=A0A0F4GMK8_9PEZI|nr:hypothetical protein TI39_contig494g00004 [Zymoseptoria brevis]